MAITNSHTGKLLIPNNADIPSPIASAATKKPAINFIDNPFDIRGNSPQ